ncbi:MAG: hypothetical protein WCV62_02915 [Candidatus Peribacteraceae bacterium]|jgi:hypothetical protein
MSRTGGIFLFLYILVGMGYTFLTRSLPLYHAVSDDARVQQAFTIALNIAGWPWNLACLWGPPGSGYGYMGATLCVILICVIAGVAYALDSASP